MTASEACTRLQSRRSVSASVDYELSVREYGEEKVTYLQDRARQEFGLRVRMLETRDALV